MSPNESQPQPQSLDLLPEDLRTLLHDRWEDTIDYPLIAHAMADNQFNELITSATTLQTLSTASPDGLTPLDHLKALYLQWFDSLDFDVVAEIGADLGACETFAGYVADWAENRDD